MNTARHEEGRYDTQLYSYVFLNAKGYRTMTSGWQVDTVVEEIPPWDRFKTDDFVEERLGDYRNNRLCIGATPPHFYELVLQHYNEN